MVTPEAVRDGLIYVLALILSIAVHEFGHAWMADRLGDRVARAQGRVTLNPIAHIDPIGTIFIPLLGAFTHMPVLGWGKPVEHSLSARFVPRWMSMNTAYLLVSVAGPAMNIALALVLGGPYVALLRTHSPVAHLVSYVIAMNVGLAFFNLIPCPPLDGRSILFWLTGDRNPIARFLMDYGPYVFLALLITGAFKLVMIPANFVTGYWLDFLTRFAF